MHLLDDAPGPSDCIASVYRNRRRWRPRKLIEGGVRIFEYLPSMLHAKCLVVDESLSVVGSANVDMRSFRLSFEIGALISDERFASVLADRFLQELKHSREVTAATLTSRSTTERLAEGVARLLSPLL